MNSQPPFQSPFDVKMRKSAAGQVEVDLTCKGCGHSFKRELPRPSVGSGTHLELVCPGCGKGKVTLTVEEIQIP